MNTKNKRKVLTLNKKIEIVEKLGRGAGISTLAREYGVAKSTICGINKKKSSIREIARHPNRRQTKRKTMRKGEYPRMEMALYNWFVKQRKRNMPLNGDIIKEKAKKLHAEIQEKYGGFNASNGWMEGFKSRYGIRLLTISEEKLSSDADAVNAFKRKLNNIIYHFQLSREHNQFFEYFSVEDAWGSSSTKVA